ncbi:hypothetical protein QTP86_004282 [Hemibagrus guttatus]|nr:hypothetical protein QTP86_004282 [Hemibagrus guttatus]
MERRKVDILCVQETRWKGSKARSIGAGFKLFYYGVDSKRNGVGVVLKEEFVRNVLEVKRVSDRVMSLKLEIEGVMLNVVSGYAPQSVKLLKFADDTTLIGLISDGNESAYRGEIDRLVSWCSTNNLELNSLKTVEMTVDFRKDPAPRPPVILCDSPVSSAESFCFLGTTITKELKWAQNISSLTKKAQQRMYFLRQLKKFLLPVKMLVNFYTAIIESVLTSSITVWFAAATARDKAKLQRVIHSAEKVIGCSLPSLQELYVSRSRRRAAMIAADPSHPDEVMESIPTGERVVIGADFNGHVGEGNTGDEEVMGKFGVKERNLEGQMVVDFAKRMDMAVVNTYFQKREEHRVTYKSGGRRTQVDYILCRRGNLKEISDCKVVVGESVARQHRMVVCRMTLMVCKTKRSKIEKEKKTKW